MSQNSSKMTLEERIVQKLKDDTLMQLIGDEDAVTELVRRAIQEALYKDLPPVGSGYDRRPEPSPAVAAAQKTAVKIADKIAVDLLNDPKVYEVLRSAMIDMLPKAIESRLYGITESILDRARIDAINNIMSLKKSGQL